MRIGQSDAAPASPPNPGPGPAPTRPAVAPSAAEPMRIDGVERDAHPFAAAADWAKEEWPTVAGLAHGLASAPGIVANAWHEAATANAEIGEKIGRAVNGWQSHPAATRATAIGDLRAAARSNPTATRIASDLEHANRLPKSIETAGTLADASLHVAGRLASATVAHRIDTAPSGVRGALRGAAGAIDFVVSGSYSAVKRAAKSTYDSTLNALPEHVERAAHDAANVFTSTAAAQEAKASGGLSRASQFVGRTAGEVLKEHVPAAAVATVAKALPALEETPVAGLVIAGGATAYDVVTHKASVADATVANVGSTLVGTAAGGAAMSALTSLAGGAGAGVAAEAAGVAIASGPVGWAVIGGIVVGAGVGYGVYKAVESEAGQHVVDGLTHFDGREVGRGFAEAGSSAGSAIGALGHFLSQTSEVLP